MENWRNRIDVMLVNNEKDYLKCALKPGYMSHKIFDDSIFSRLFTETDSLKYEIKTEDVYEDFSSNKDMLDFSNYLSKSKYCDHSNKLVVEKMKDETRGDAIEEFVGLRVKMYSFLVEDNNEPESCE